MLKENYSPETSSYLYPCGYMDFKIRYHDGVGVTAQSDTNSTFRGDDETDCDSFMHGSCLILQQPRHGIGYTLWDDYDLRYCHGKMSRDWLLHGTRYVQQDRHLNLL